MAFHEYLVDIPHVDVVLINMKRSCMFYFVLVRLSDGGAQSSQKLVQKTTKAPTLTAAYRQQIETTDNDKAKKFPIEPGLRTTSIPSQQHSPGKYTSPIKATMAVLGKRKAPEPTISSEDAQEIFRRHFEAQFLPLEEQEKSKAQKVRRNEDEDEEEDEDDSDGSGEDEWDGVSGDEISDEDDDELDDDDEEEEDEDGRSWNDRIHLLSRWILYTDSDPQDAPIIEVVDHSAPQSSKANTMSKRELKAFMVSSPLYPPI